MADGPGGRPELRLPSPLLEIADERLASRGLRLYLKRDDLIHPDLPGNKWRKLKYNIETALLQGHSTLLTFGGAYSNHLLATAAAGHYFGLATIGIVRGEEHDPLNPTLARAVDFGMRLNYLDRTTYRRKTDPAVLDSLTERLGDFYLVPEGGSNEHAVRGCAELPAEIDVPFDVICCATGTGGTLAGIAAGLERGQRALGFAVLKGAEFLAGDVRRLQAVHGTITDNWSVVTGYHFGGYARRTAALDDFIADFHARHGLRLDWVYVAKLMYGIFEEAARGTFPPGTTIVAVVTG